MCGKAHKIEIYTQQIEFPNMDEKCVYTDVRFETMNCGLEIKREDSDLVTIIPWHRINKLEIHY